MPYRVGIASGRCACAFLWHGDTFLCRWHQNAGWLGVRERGRPVWPRIAQPPENAGGTQGDDQVDLIGLIDLIDLTPKGYQGFTKGPR